MRASQLQQVPPRSRFFCFKSDAADLVVSLSVGSLYVRKTVEST